MRSLIIFYINFWFSLGNCAESFCRVTRRPWWLWFCREKAHAVALCLPRHRHLESNAAERGRRQRPWTAPCFPPCTLTWGGYRVAQCSQSCHCSTPCFHVMLSRLLSSNILLPGSITRASVPVLPLEPWDFYHHIFFPVLVSADPGSLWGIKEPGTTQFALYPSPCKTKLV